MSRKLLAVFICLCVAILSVSCGKVAAPKESDTEVIKEPANESLPAPTTQTEQAETVKEGTSPKESKATENNVTEEEPCEEQTEQAEDNVWKCSLSVRCDTIFQNIAEFDKEKVEYLPKNGVIFPETEVVFHDGESVFNVLTRELKKSKIHIDFVNTPMYHTVYIRGISNLYERDCGDLSGWIYQVNGAVPSYGCSQYLLKNGDKIEFVYTCNLGKDVDG